MIASTFGGAEGDVQPMSLELLNTFDANSSTPGQSLFSTETIGGREYQFA